MALCRERLHERIGVELQEVRIAADEALRVDVARQLVVLALLDLFNVEGTDARALLDILVGQTLFFPRLAQCIS